MASRLTPLGIAAKWVVAPLLVALFGYLAISPFVGRLPKRVESAGRAAITKISTVAEKAKLTPSDSVGPQVDIQVETSPVRRRSDRSVDVTPSAMPDTTISSVAPPAAEVPKPKPRKPRKRKHRVEPNTIDESSTATEKAPDPEKIDPASSGAIPNP